jgi:iron complex transport system ATP-binding protein
MRKNLIIKNLTTGYRQGNKDDVVLQQKMNASLETGQLVCVLGPNGAGKSTLLRTLAGFQKALKGDILFDGISLKTLDLKRLSRLVSVVLTDRFSDLYLTAFDVVRMGRFPYASFFGRMGAGDLSLINQTMEKLGVAVLKKKLFYNLSDGERQKILIARALVQDTPFLLLDEPVAFIDSPGRIEIMELLTILAHEQKKAILMTTHDMDAGLRYADNLWLMHRQKPLLTGAPEDLVLQGKVGEYFQRPGLRFDRNKGLFRSDRKAHATRGTVFVKLENQEVKWLAKALERNDFAVEETDGIPEKGIFGCYESGSFQLYRDAKLMGVFQSIADVLEKLEDISGG